MYAGGPYWLLELSSLCPSLVLVKADGVSHMIALRLTTCALCVSLVCCQFSQLTVRSQHFEALAGPPAQDPDVVELFGRETLQVGW
jgi:hypothetical protein